MKELKKFTLKTSTCFAEDNIPNYFIDQTDKVSLIDREGQVRRSYYGSELNSEEVVEGIKKLLKET